jgi:hypothetical protein
MATTLRDTITELASTFATELLRQIRGMSLDALLALTRPIAEPHNEAAEEQPSRLHTKTKSGANERLGRRSARDIAVLVDRIVRLLETRPDGLRAEQIRVELGVEAKELSRPLVQALADGVITKLGQKRATTYFARPT